MDRPSLYRFVLSLLVSALAHVVAALFLADGSHLRDQMFTPKWAEDRTLFVSFQWHSTAPVLDKQSSATVFDDKQPHADDAGPTPSLPVTAERARGANVVPEDLEYIPSHQLDRSPEVVLDVPIDPPDLRGVAGQGKMVLTLWINSGGTVDHVSVEESDLNAVFEASTVKNFYAARFQPGIKSGMAVPTKMTIEVTYLPQPTSPAIIKSQIEAAGN